jgi:predicted  nucleic acid-binding Zn-ribbon protein
VETQIAMDEAERASSHAERQALQELVARVDAEVEAELARLDEARLRWVPHVAAAVLAAYERVRAQPRAGGRGAATIAEGRCTGCRIKLPSLELRRMLAEPEDALLQCPQCRRVLVRDGAPIEADASV